MNKEQLIEKAIKETLVIENHESIHIAVKRIIDSLNTRTESKPIQVSDAMIEKQFPLYQEQRIKQTGGHYEVIPSINYLNQAKQTGAKWALSQQSEVSQEYFDKIHSILDDSEGWVSVDDRLPEINKPVLIFAKYGKQATARRTGELWIDLMRTQHSYGSITHWQPLPNPPKE